MTHIDEIKPLENNPRQITGDALAKLMQSIERDPQFMLLRPIVVDESGTILGGNQRYTACRKLGLKHLPDGWVVKVDDLTPEQKKRFVLIDNAPQGMAGTWDAALLQSEYSAPELEELGFAVQAAERELQTMIETETEHADPKTDTGELIARITRRLEEIAANEPDLLDGAKAIILPLKRGNSDSFILVDPATTDAITELKRHAEAGEPSPMDCLLASVFSMRGRGK